MHVSETDTNIKHGREVVKYKNKGKINNLRSKVQSERATLPISLMKMVDLDLVKFLVINHEELLAMPLSGQLGDVFSLFLADQESQWGTNVELVSFEEFSKALDDVANLAPQSLVYQEDSLALVEGRRLEFIDVFSLQILYNSCRQVRGPIAVNQPELRQDLPLLERLMAVLDNKLDRSDALSRGRLLQRLEDTLAVKPAFVSLGKERAQKTVPVAEFIPICRNERHTSMLSTCMNISNNKIVSLQWVKVNKIESECNGFVNCLKNKIHYVPNLHPQTEKSLGDCSYLDTCHKLNSCRYIHYLQYVPECLREKVSELSRITNKEINQQRRVPFYTLGTCCADSSKSLLPPQWICCDVRKFDFSCLGKFSAVIADPAWNIHMNLPYGTCNDIELLGLPLEQLQDEGVLLLWVTGRAIDLGKESLEKWGYQVVNEISWIKTNQLGRTIVTGRTGHWLNHSKEHLLMGLKGNPVWLNKQIDTDIIVSTTRETSRKPDELYGLVERLVGRHARKLEIFGRDHNKRPGWLTIGNQVTGTCIRELDVKKRYENSRSLNGTKHFKEN